MEDCLDHLQPVAVARLSEDRRRFTLSVAKWSGTYDIRELYRWLAFYRGLVKKRPASWRFYASTIQALERLKAEVDRGG